MAFTLEERQHMGIHGLLPPAVLSQNIQTLRVMANIHRAQGKLIFYSKFIEKISSIDDLARYNEMMNLSDRNEKLFYRVIQGKLIYF